MRNALALLVRQPGGLGVLRGVVRGFSEEARTRGFPSPPLGGFGFIGVASDSSIVRRWHIGSRLPMSALGHKQTLRPILAQCPLLGAERTFDHPGKR